MPWKQEQLKRQKHRCFYCRCLLDVTKYDTEARRNFLPANAATIDHVRSKAHGGSSRARNKVLACLTCNNRKGSMTLLEFELSRLELT